MGLMDLKSSCVVLATKRKGKSVSIVSKNKTRKNLAILKIMSWLPFSWQRGNFHVQFSWQFSYSHKFRVFVYIELGLMGKFDMWLE